MAVLIGLQQFEKKLKELEFQVRGEVLRKALLRAVQPVVRQAATLAPVGSGKLSRSMTAQVMTYAPAFEGIVRVGPGKPEGSHGILLEHGTIYMTKRPFLGTAFQATEPEVIIIMKAELSTLMLELEEE